MHCFSRATNALLFALWIWALPAQAQDFDPCPRMMDAGGAEASKVRVFWNLFAEDHEDTGVAPYSENEFYVTTSPGRFVNVRCDEAQFEEQEMYPIGIVLKPIAYVQLTDFEASRGDRAILVVTEYGQRKLVREKHIQPIIQNLTYIFSDTPLNSRICRRIDDCPGSSTEICARPQKCRYEVSAKYGYATAASNNPLAKAAIAAYFLIRDDKSAQDDWWGDEEKFKRMQSVDETACNPFPVRAYRHGGLAHQPRDSYLSLCSQRAASGAQANALFPMKIVTQNYAKRAFSWQLDGSFHRRFAVPSSGQDTSLLGALSDYRVTSVKECGTKLSETSGFDASGGIKATLSAGFVEINAGAEAKLNTEITRTLSEDDYLLMSTYFIDPISNAPTVSEEDDNDLWFFRVIFRSKCENGTPKSATSIIIHYHRLSGRVLEVRTSDDLQRSYLKDWADYAYVPDNSASALREGQFWTVPDLAGYFIWRDTLRNFIEVENNVTSSLLSRHPEAQRPYVRDFFVYLMLAAAFHHRDPAI